MALNNREPWRYFEDPATPNDEAAALVLLRTAMGPSWASTPDDATLSRVLAFQVRKLERITGRFFVRRDGTLSIHGNDTPRLQLPYPVIDATQTGAALTTPILDPSVTLWDNTDPEDSEELLFNAGAWEGEGDPRASPFVEWTTDGPYSTQTSRPPRIAQGTRRFAYGVRNVHVSASWGYLEDDGTTPELILQALAMMVVLGVEGNDDSCAINERRRGALIAESTEGRSYSYAGHAVSAGPTLQREIDQILRDYRRPPSVVVSRSPRRRSRSRYYLE